MKLYTINTGFFKLDGGAMFGVVPKSIWNRIYPADENNLITMAMRCLLVEDEGRLILVDNGIGDKQDAKFLSHYYLHGEDSLDSSLEAKGFTRDDITDVFLTHLHFDHCGGSIMRQGDRLLPAFRNASYWSNEKHWAWAMEPNDREKASFLKENILPIRESGQLRMVPLPADGTHGLVDFSAHTKVRFSSGHTKAMMLLQIDRGGQTLVFMADLIPTIAHLPIPYIMGYDTQPLKSMVEKKAFLREALEKHYTLFFEHDAGHECCTLEMTEKGIRAGKILSLADWLAG